MSRFILCIKVRELRFLQLFHKRSSFCTWSYRIRMIFKSIYLTHRWNQVLPLWINVDLGIMAMKKSSIFFRFPEQEPHHQTQFSVRPKTPHFREKGLIPLKEIQSAYIKPIFVSSLKWYLLNKFDGFNYSFRTSIEGEISISFFWWYISLFRLFNAKGTHLEEQEWYYLTYSWEDKGGVHTSPKSICPKVNVIARLDFELTYYDSTVQCFNH